MNDRKGELIEMKFLDNNVDVTKIKDHEIFKITRNEEGIVDVWLPEGNAYVTKGKDGNIDYRISEEGIYGVIEYAMLSVEGELMESITCSLYTEMFNFINKHSGYKLVRVWNYIPSILKDLKYTAPDIEIYRCFNKGRFNAFLKEYGMDMSNWIIPAASGVGSNTNCFKIEFFASTGETKYIENKNQIPAYKYSYKYGKLPPVFSRGAIWTHKDKAIFMASGTASILNEDSVYIDDLQKQIIQSIKNLQMLISTSNLKEYGVEFGFNIEDAVLLRVYYRYEKDREFITSELTRILPSDCKICLVKSDICRNNLLVEIEGIFRAEQYSVSL